MASCVSSSASITGQRDLPNGDIIEIAARFRALRARLYVIDQQARPMTCVGKSPDAGELEDSVIDEISCLREQLYELAWQLCDVSAGTLDDAKLKARILDDRCNEQDHGDIIAALARSLSRDLLLMRSTGNSKPLAGQEQHQAPRESRPLSPQSELEH